MTAPAQPPTFRYVIRNYQGSYFKGFTGENATIPMFGATLDNAFRFDTRFAAVDASTGRYSYAFVGSEIEEVPA